SKPDPGRPGTSRTRYVEASWVCPSVEWPKPLHGVWVRERFEHATSVSFGCYLQGSMNPRPPTDAKRRLPVFAPAEALSAHPPIARESRAVDRAWRPHYAVWEITLRCDLSCRHCSSRAGRARDDELSTSEALGLISQMSALGVEEITLI